MERAAGAQSLWQLLLFKTGAADLCPNILLYSDLQESTFDLRQLPTQRFEAMDHFSKCFLIVKLKCEQETDARAARDWKAIRVDLVAPPLERYAYALLGWTGSTAVRYTPSSTHQL
ncbi:DNA nucleotidylexotransferase [Labeo rohita]|uniref:DNA nucleotidylexotransferase n=1 Tax=Labeo rohita TaxID=84645 RepID=A0ABQ8M5H3_LABRO|nr:DNA nucleotidylexotransferase [Labeo rohita]